MNSIVSACREPVVSQNMHQQQQSNRIEIMKKVIEQLELAKPVAVEYAKNNGFEGVYVSYFRYNFKISDLKKEEPLPLLKYVVRQEIGQWDNILGVFTIYPAEREELEDKVRNGITPNLQEIYDKSLAEMKSIIDYRVKLKNWDRNITAVTFGFCAVI